MGVAAAYFDQLTGVKLRIEVAGLGVWICPGILRMSTDAPMNQFLPRGSRQIDANTDRLAMRSSALPMKGCPSFSLPPTAAPRS